MGDRCYQLSESFEDGRDPRWIEYGVRGSGMIAIEDRGRVARLQAGPKIGDEVGKACMVAEFPQPLHVGDGLEIAASFRIPEISGGRISLIDIECKYCGVPDQPGIRLFVNPDRTIYLERAKLGLTSALEPGLGAPTMPVDKWADVRWRIVFGKGTDGHCALWIDGALALDAAGANFPDGEVAKTHRVTLTAEQYDRVQIGLTANSQPGPATLEMADIDIAADYAGGCDDSD